MSERQIRLAGTGGQGLILAGRILAESLTREGLQVAQSQTYEPTSRGGASRADLVVARTLPDYPLVTALDHLVILDQIAVEGCAELLQPTTLILFDGFRVSAPPLGGGTRHALAFTETARRLGSERVTNIVALAALVALTDLCPFETLGEVVRARAPKALLDLNLNALAAGRDLVAAIAAPTAATATAAS